MGIFEKLFNPEEKNVVTSREIKIALARAESTLRREKFSGKKLKTKQKEILGRLKDTRQNNDSDEFDYLYEQLKQNKIDQALNQKDLKRLHLEIRGLTQYQRSFERLERANKTGTIRNIMKRVQASNLDSKLNADTVDEEAYMDMLQATMDEVAHEMEALSSTDYDSHDPEKDKLIAELDELIAAEEDGNSFEALKREENLKKILDQEQ